MNSMKNPFPVACFFALAASALISGCKERTFNSKGNSVDANPPAEPASGVQSADDADWAKRNDPDAAAGRAQETDEKGNPCARVCPKHYYCSFTKDWWLQHPDFYSVPTEASPQLGKVVPGSTVCTSGEISRGIHNGKEYEMLKVRVPLTEEENRLSGGKIPLSKWFPGFSQPVFMNCKFMSSNTRNYRGCKGD
jgi:hypothetical protein